MEGKKRVPVLKPGAKPGTSPEPKASGRAKTAGQTSHRASHRGVDKGSDKKTAGKSTAKPKSQPKAVAAASSSDSPLPALAEEQPPAAAPAAPELWASAPVPTPLEDSPAPAVAEPPPAVAAPSPAVAAPSPAVAATAAVEASPAAVEAVAAAVEEETKTAPPASSAEAERVVAAPEAAAADAKALAPPPATEAAEATDTSNTGAPPSEVSEPVENAGAPFAEGAALAEGAASAGVGASAEGLAAAPAVTDDFAEAVGAFVEEFAPAPMAVATDAPADDMEATATASSAAAVEAPGAEAPPSTEMPTSAPATDAPADSSEAPASMPPAEMPPAEAPGSAEADTLFNSLDADGDGVITKPEFTSALAKEASAAKLQRSATVPIKLSSSTAGDELEAASVDDSSVGGTEGGSTEGGSPGPVVASTGALTGTVLPTAWVKAFQSHANDAIDLTVGEVAWMQNPFFKDGTKLRTGPEQEAEMLEQYILNDDKVRVVEVNQTTGFVRVCNFDEDPADGWVRAQNVSKIERKAGLPDLGALAQMAVNALKVSEAALRDVEDHLRERDDEVAKLKQDVEALRNSVSKYKAAAILGATPPPDAPPVEGAPPPAAAPVLPLPGSSGATFEGEDIDLSPLKVGERCFMLNPFFADGTRLRATPDATGDFNDQFVMNDREVEILATSEDFVHIHEVHENDDGTHADGWVRARNISRVRRASGLAQLRKSIAILKPLAMSQQSSGMGSAREDAETDRSEAASMRGGRDSVENEEEPVEPDAETGATPATGPVATKPVELRKRGTRKAGASVAFDDSSKPAINLDDIRPRATELAQWLKKAIETSNVHRPPPPTSLGHVLPPPTDLFLVIRTMPPAPWWHVAGAHDRPVPRLGRGAQGPSAQG